MKNNFIGILVFLSAFVTSYLLVLVSMPTIQNETVYRIESKTIPEKVAITSELDSLEVINDDIDNPEKFAFQLLQTGSGFHADQIEARNGEKWLGLFNERGNYYLRTTTLRIKRVPDELVHGPTSDRKGKLTGKSIAVNEKSTPIFLVNNARRLREGSVTTLFEGEKENWKNETVKPTFLDKNFRQTYELAGKTYELKVIKAKNKRGDPILALMLESDGGKQLLHTLGLGPAADHKEYHWLESVGTLYWVGDLDKDERPDFYLSLYAHETIYNAFLLLSSEAEKGKFVKKVALFETSGCG